MTPKVFISYSWTTQIHQSLVEQWAERLISDGVEVILDIYDLKEGNDKFAFMERMVTDLSITNVIAFCDRIYAEKADARKDGVGTESQIISAEIYSKVDQSKFVPIVCEFAADGSPFLPTFFKFLIWIDFSTPESVNDNWERLIRLLFGKPLHEKPKLGKPPIYITSDISTPVSPISSKFNTFKQAILQGKKGLSIYRKDFFDSCFQFADALRVRDRPDVDSLGERVLADSGKLKQVRNHIIDWILIESTVTSENDLIEILIPFLEEIRTLKSRPAEISTWSNSWFEAHSLFIYETFLYLIAALIKTNSFQILHEVFTSNYLLLESEVRGDKRFVAFDSFYAHSDALQSVLSPAGQQLYSPAAELIKRQADRDDISFQNIIEADLLVLLIAFITQNTRWFPQTFYYASYNSSFPLFIRATQHKYFQKLAIVTGINNVEELRTKVREGHERLNTKQWHNFYLNSSFWESLNMDKLDSLK